MATIMRGPHDALIDKLKGVLEEYERQHPGASATFYRNDDSPVHPGPIRIRIVDDRFAKWPKPQRHDDAWNFISDRLSDDDLQEVSVLLLLSQAEQRSSLMNFEFDDVTQ
jgi:hypothetical protein